MAVGALRRGRQKNPEFETTEALLPESTPLPHSNARHITMHSLPNCEENSLVPGTKSLSLKGTDRQANRSNKHKHKA